jgi:hypothetical protein
MLSAMLVLMTIMFIMLGVVSELLVRIYHESQGRRIYRVRNVYRGSADDASGEPAVMGATGSAARPGEAAHTAGTR